MKAGQTSTELPTAPIERIAYTGAEVQRLLSICPTTLWRLEKRKLLLPVPNLRHKLYSKKAVEAFLEGKVAA